MSIEAIPPPTRILDIPPHNRLPLTCHAGLSVANIPIPFNVTFHWLLTKDNGSTKNLIPRFFTNSNVYGSAVDSQFDAVFQVPGFYNITCQVLLNLFPAPGIRSMATSYFVISHGK